MSLPDELKTAELDHSIKHLKGAMCGFIKALVKGEFVVPQKDAGKSE